VHTANTTLDAAERLRRPRGCGSSRAGITLTLGRPSADASGRGADLERFRAYRASRDRGLRNSLVEGHLWLAEHCARRFAGKGEPLDDLLQVAMLGVLKAVERFDPEYGVTFATFAVPTITGELRRHFRDTTWAVHVPRRARDLQHTVKQAIAELSQILGRSPTANEVADHAGIDVDAVLEAVEAANCYRPTDPPALPADADDVDLGNVGDENQEYDRVVARITVEGLLDQLPARERRIVELRYLRGLTQAQIATLVGVSQVHVSRLLRASLAKMHGSANDPRS
jgi:RNA polymerase sigma-B factor